MISKMYTARCTLLLLQQQHQRALFPARFLLAQQPCRQYSISYKLFKTTGSASSTRSFPGVARQHPLSKRKPLAKRRSRCRRRRSRSTESRRWSARCARRPPDKGPPRRKRRANCSRRSTSATRQSSTWSNRQSTWRSSVKRRSHGAPPQKQPPRKSSPSSLS